MEDEPAESTAKRTRSSRRQPQLAESPPAPAPAPAPVKRIGKKTGEASKQKQQGSKGLVEVTDPPVKPNQAEEPKQPPGKFESAFLKFLNKQRAEVDNSDSEEDAGAPDDRFEESEYERERKKNIEANNQILAGLGLVGPIIANVVPEQVKLVTKKPAKPRAKSLVAEAAEFQDRRRSARLSAKPIGAEEAGEAATIPEGSLLGSVFDGKPTPSWEPRIELGKGVFLLLFLQLILT